MPVKAGIHCAAPWVPAFAGTTIKLLKTIGILKMCVSP
jgi:hypothetical protein